MDPRRRYDYEFLKRKPFTWTEREHELAQMLYFHELYAYEKSLWALDRRKLLGDSTGLGYGRSERWPLDIARAIQSTGYYHGVLNAVRNPLYSNFWKERAMDDIERIVIPALLARAAEVRDATLAFAMDEWPEGLPPDAVAQPVKKKQK